MSLADLILLRSAIVLPTVDGEIRVATSGGPGVLAMLRDDSGNGGGRPSSPRNVLGDRLDVCSTEPKTGFFRDGEDVGSHTVCAVMTAAFLEFSKSRRQ